MLQAAAGLLWFAACAAGMLLGGGVLQGAEPLRLYPKAVAYEAAATVTPLLAPPAEAQPTPAEPLLTPSAPPSTPEVAPPMPDAPLAPMPVESFRPVEPFPAGEALPADSYFPVAPMPVSAGDCNAGVRYWIVSSRQAPQDPHHVGCGHLDVFERRCDGSLCPTGLPNLVASLQPGAPILISLHGSWVGWEDNLIQSDATWCWIRRGCPNLPLNVIFFTWPSDRTRCLLAPCELARQGVEAEVNAFYVASLLAYLPDCHPICVLGHSYGARMAMATMHLLGGGALHGMTFPCTCPQRIRVILAAGALDHNWLNDGGRYCRALCRAECVLNLRNRHDIALKAYPLLRPLLAHRALGASGVTFFDRHQQTCTCRIHDLDVTDIVQVGHFWPKYYASSQLARMLASWVYFPDVNPGYMATPMTMTPLAQSLTEDAAQLVTAIEAEERATQVAIADEPAPARKTSSTSKPRASTTTTNRTTTASQPRLMDWLRGRAD
jgi:hypothetical protein